MRPIRNALLAACAIAVPLGLAAAAHAQSTPRGIMLYTADGTPFGLLTPVQNGARLPTATFERTPGALSVEQIVQRQDAMMDRLFSTMRAMFDAPLAIPAMPGDQGRLVVTTFGAGPGVTTPGFCGQTVTYTFDGRSTEPTVHVQKVGDACGTAAPPPARTIEAKNRTTPTGTRAYDIAYR